MTAAVLPADIRAARGFLQSRGIPTSKVSPRQFAASSKELGKPFGALLRYLNLLMSGGQGNGPSETATASKDRLDPARALGHQTPEEAMKYDGSQGDYD